MDEYPAYALEVSPNDALQFTLSRISSTTVESKSDGASRCSMTLRHTKKTDSHIAFKVKTTQPRRYLVRPNQGIVSPGKSETVTILLVEKDKQVLLQSYDRLGQSALDHSKDKFLVQSCVVSDEFAQDYVMEKEKINDNGSEEASKIGKNLTEALTGMWNAAGSSTTIDVFNKKLQVRHVVAPGVEGVSEGGSRTFTSNNRSAPVSASAVDSSNLDSMTTEQMYSEISSLRRKYDELVSFSVNLTAERDILNNTLEQTKRELNREMGARATLETLRDGGGGKHTSGVKKGEKSSAVFTVVFVAVFFFFIGVKATTSKAIDFLFDTPLFGDFIMHENNDRMLEQL